MFVKTHEDWKPTPPTVHCDGKKSESTSTFTLATSVTTEAVHLLHPTASQLSSYLDIDDW